MSRFDSRGELKKGRRDWYRYQDLFSQVGNRRISLEIVTDYEFIVKGSKTGSDT